MRLVASMSLSRRALTPSSLMVRIWPQREGAKGSERMQKTILCSRVQLVPTSFRTQYLALHAAQALSQLLEVSEARLSSEIEKNQWDVHLLEGHGHAFQP